MWKEEIICFFPSYAKHLFANARLFISNFPCLLSTDKVTPTTYYGYNELYSLLSTIKKHLCCYTMHLKFKMKHIWSELRGRLENR